MKKFIQYEVEDDEPEIGVQDQWVRMSNGQFFQIQRQMLESDSIDLDDQMQTVILNHDDNPYASINLEEESKAAQIEQEMMADKLDPQFVKTALPNSGVFDENQVHFVLESGTDEQKYQSEAIYASAILKTTGDPIPLTCAWYNIPKLENDKDGALQLIENANGACFQPSIEDIGTKICVQAMPAENDALAQQYQGMPLFAEVGPLLLDPLLSQEADKIVTSTIDNYQDLKFGIAISSPRVLEGSKEVQSQKEPFKAKEFKLMSVNSLRISESSQIIQHKKNMKIPSTIKLVGILTDKSFDIYKKQQNLDQPFISIEYGQYMSYKIIRHSNTRICLKDSDTAEIEFTLESSYQRDLFALVFKRMNDRYLELMSKTDLQEIDFYKRRETYLQKQISVNANEIKKMKGMVSQRDSQLCQKDTEINQLKMCLEDNYALEDSYRIIQELQQKMIDLEKEINSVSQDLLFAQQDNQIYQNDNDKLKKQIQKLQKKLENKSDEKSEKSFEISNISSYYAARNRSSISTQTEANNESEGPQSDQIEILDSYKTELNALKKSNASLIQESKKKLENQYCSGCKVELLFNSENRSVSQRSKSLDESMTEQEDCSVVSTSVQIAENLPRASLISNQEQSHLDSLEILAEENNQMKMTISDLLKQLALNKFQLEESQHIVHEEQQTCSQYKTLMLLTQQTFKSSLFQSSNNIEMQKLISQLTLTLTEKDEQLSVQKTLNRQLKESLDQATRGDENPFEAPSRTSTTSVDDAPYMQIIQKVIQQIDEIEPSPRGNKN